jgi:predicted O-methyltransferase YrrM
MPVTFASGMAVDLPPSVEALAEEHATSMLDASELFHLAGALALMPVRGEAGLVAEIGAYRGRTTVFMARVLRELGKRAAILSIDPFEGARRDALNPKGSLGAWLKAVRAAGFEDVCIPIVSTSRVAAAAVPGALGVLVVDGDHRYESVAADLALYGPKLLPGGLCFVDDYAPPYTGVERAVDEFFERSREFTILHRSYFVVARKAGPP